MVFAGATVVVALAALAVVTIPFLTVMSLGAAASLVVSVLVAVTLLPAVLGLMGTAVAISTVPVLARITRRSAEKQAARNHRTLGECWAATTARRPWTVLIMCVLGLGILAA
ncbi:MMPL family transporter, partial [Streptomyces sp. MCAF7]